MRERRKRVSDRRAVWSHDGITSGRFQPSPHFKVCLLVFELNRNVDRRGLGLDQPPAGAGVQLWSTTVNKKTRPIIFLGAALIFVLTVEMIYYAFQCEEDV